VRTVLLIAVAAAGLIALPATASDRARETPPRPPSPVTTPPSITAHDILSAPEVGAIAGVCRPGARTWRLEFRQHGPADDLLQLRVGGGRTRRIDVRPGSAFAWRVAAGTAVTREPADPVINAPAQRLATSPVSHLLVYQGTEPHIFRLAITLAVTAARGDTDDCAPVQSSLSFRTY
jgi:hypothetical protein